MVLSFAITMVVFILLRVVGVSQFLDLITDIIDFSSTSALNFMVWIGVGVMLVVAFIIINATVDMDKFKMNFNIGFAGLISIGIVFVYSYNYIGYNYPALFAGLDMFQRLVTSAPYWVGLFAVYGLPDIFIFWVLISIIFFIVLAVMMFVDVKQSTFSALFGKRKKSKNEHVYYPSQYAASLAVSLILHIVTFALLQLFGKDAIVFSTFSPLGIATVVLVSLITTVAFIGSLRITRSDEFAFAAYFIVSTVVNSVIMAFLSTLEALTAIVMTSSINVIIYVVSKAVVRRL